MKIVLIIIGVIILYWIYLLYKKIQDIANAPANAFNSVTQDFSANIQSFESWLGQSFESWLGVHQNDFAPGDATNVDPSTGQVSVGGAGGSW